MKSASASSRSSSRTAKRRSSVRPPAEAFLSFAGADESFASRLADTLRRHRVRVWFAPRSIRGAQQWHDEIGDALRRCDWFLLVLSPAAVRSAWVKRELVYALQQARYTNRIAPLLVRSCKFEKLSWTLSGIQLFDFTASLESGCRRLLQTWRLRYRPPKLKP